MEYEIDIDGMMDSLYEESLEIDNECLRLSDRLKTLRKRNKKICALLNELRLIEITGRVSDEVLLKISDHFGPEAIKIV